jgi:hypothetical protein
VDPSKPSSPDLEAVRARYGVQVVFAGLAVVLAAFAIAVIAYSEASGVSTALAPITGVVGTIVGAYFGVQVGSAGKQGAETARDKAEDQAKKLAAVAPAKQAAGVLGFDLAPDEVGPGQVAQG